MPPWKVACLDAMVTFTQSTKCRRRHILEYFGELSPSGGGGGAASGAGGVGAAASPAAPFQCTGCDNCEATTLSVDLSAEFRILAQVSARVWPGAPAKPAPRGRMFPTQAIAFCGGRTGMRKAIDFVLGKGSGDVGRGPDPTRQPFYGKGSKTLGGGKAADAYWQAVLQFARAGGIVRFVNGGQYEGRNDPLLLRASFHFPRAARSSCRLRMAASTRRLISRRQVAAFAPEKTFACPPSPFRSTCGTGDGA